MPNAVARTLGGAALLLLAAHFFRAGVLPLAALALTALGLLFVRSLAAVRVLQAALALGVLEWLRTAWVFASARADAGQPYGRLLLILGSVAALTAVAAWLLGRAALPGPAGIASPIAARQDRDT